MKQKKKRIRLSSLSFRINVILILVMIFLGWGFTRVISTIVTAVTNSSRCVTMANIVCGNIDNELLRIESVMKAGALSLRSKNQTTSSLLVTCDSIRSMAGVDTVYVTNGKAYASEISRCIGIVRATGASMWSDPHHANNSDIKSYGDAVVTFVTPLRTAHGFIHGVMCADVSMTWLQQLTQKEKATENTSLTIVSNNGRYVYSSDTTQILSEVDPYENLDEKIRQEMKEEKIRIKDSIRHERNISKKANDKADALEQILHGVSISDSLTTVNRNIDRTGWTVQCTVPIKDDSTVNVIIMAIVIVLLCLLFFIIIVAIIFTVRWQLGPLKTITYAMSEASKGNFTARLPEVKGHTEVRRLRDSFERMQIKLQHYISDLQKTTEIKASMERDIEIASRIQASMLPEHFPAFPEDERFGIYGLLKPAKLVGGDLFDFFLREDKLFFCIGDVSGKGVPAALIMTVVDHLFRNVGRHVTNPAKIASAINVGLADGNDQNMFCTLFVGVLDLNTGLLHYCNAGHNAPIFSRKGTSAYMTTDITVPTGVLEDYEYRSQQLQLQPGDTIFMYTDGVTEAENKDKKLFGDDQTLEAVGEMMEVLRGTLPAHSCKIDVEQLAEGMLKTVQNFVDGAEQSDDLTILTLKFN